jgi:hypothetical protein
MTGPLLYQSDAFSVTTSTFSEFRFDVGGLTLVEGRQYVAILSSSAVEDGADDAVAAGYLGSNAYPGGGAGGFDQGGGTVWKGNGSDFASLYSGGWTASPNDLAFRAEFGPVEVAVPGPSGLALAVTGLAAGAFFRRLGPRRQNSSSLASTAPLPAAVTVHAPS